MLVKALTVVVPRCCESKLSRRAGSHLMSLAGPLICSSGWELSVCTPKQNSFIITGLHLSVLLVIKIRCLYLLLKLWKVIRIELRRNLHWAKEFQKSAVQNTSKKLKISFVLGNKETDTTDN